MNLDETVLDEKLAELEAVQTWSPRLIARLEALLRGDDERKLVHLNPLAFAKEQRLNEAEVIDLFLHAAKRGLLELEWRVICPACALALESFGALKHVDHRLYCEICHVAVEVKLDDYIQVCFTVSPRARRLAWHDPSRLSAREELFQYRFCAEARLPDGGLLRDMFAATVPICERLEPRRTRHLELELCDGFLSGADPVSHADFLLTVSGEKTDRVQPLTLTLEQGRYRVESPALRPGPARLEVRNASDRWGTLLLSTVAAGSPGLPKATFSPFLTGGRALSHQTFRRLFRSEVIHASEGIGVREATLLFTDLQGSTALYEKIGDLAAFGLVRQHFERLAEVVQAFDGAVVKTIGDAVMAVFHDPARAFAAAAKMLEAIDAFNREHGAEAVVLKVGLHRGSTIAVTLNETADYFGQTVNVAARVQGLAQGQEICFTDAIAEVAGVSELLRGFEVRPRDEKLKGVERQVRVFAARRSDASAVAA